METYGFLAVVVLGLAVGAFTMLIGIRGVLTRELRVSAFAGSKMHGAAAVRAGWVLIVAGGGLLALIFAMSEMFGR